MNELGLQVPLTEVSRRIGSLLFFGFDSSLATHCPISFIIWYWKPQNPEVVMIDETHNENFR